MTEVQNCYIYKHLSTEVHIDDFSQEVSSRAVCSVDKRRSSNLKNFPYITERLCCEPKE